MWNSVEQTLNPYSSITVVSDTTNTIYGQEYFIAYTLGVY